VKTTETTNKTVSGDSLYIFSFMHVPLEAGGAKPRPGLTGLYAPESTAAILDPARRQYTKK